jgi:hypothetical protein
MHTPTHAALNFLVLGRDPGSPRLWIVMGAVLPDVPMFGFFLYERFVRGEATRRIFQDLYFEPHWQTLFDVSHSIPLFLLFAAFFWWRRSSTGLLFAISLLLQLDRRHGRPISRTLMRTSGRFGVSRSGRRLLPHGGSPLALELGIIFLAAFG